MSKIKKDTNIIVGSTDDNIIITSMDEKLDIILSGQLDKFDPSNRKYSVYLKDMNTNVDDLTVDVIDELAVNPQEDISKILRINAIIEPLINKDGLIGTTYSIIEQNTNGEVKLTYLPNSDKKITNKKIEKVKTTIDNFNNQINLKKFIRDATASTYAKGNRVLYLRGNSKDGWIIDVFPLKVAIISEYTVNGHPEVLIDVTTLTNALKKTYEKTKNKQPLFYNKIEDEIKATYPDEIYQAFIRKEKYAKLDINRTGVIRIGNMDKRYGLSPIFRSLKDYLMVNTLSTADRINSNATARKIIHQTLRKELLENGDNDRHYNQMAYAHDVLMESLRQSVSIVTSPAYVESIKYIEPSVKLTDVALKSSYEKAFANSLGISFLTVDNGSTVATAGISVDQLMKKINMITEGVESVLEKFYHYVLVDSGLSTELSPKIEIIDSELLEFSLRKELSEYLFNRLNASYDTAYNVLGFDVEDERIKREIENEKKYDDIFYPRLTSSTVSKDDDVGGRPSGTDENKEDKKIYDKTRQENL